LYYLEGCNKEKLAERLGYYLSELNVLHPFREGNGRTIREFIRELAFKNGFILDLRETEAKELLEASKLSVIDTKSLNEILYRCLKEEV